MRFLLLVLNPEASIDHRIHGDAPTPPRSLSPTRLVHPLPPLLKLHPLKQKTYTFECAKTVHPIYPSSTKSLNCAPNDSVGRGKAHKGLEIGLRIDVAGFDGSIAFPKPSNLAPFLFPGFSHFWLKKWEVLIPAEHRGIHYLRVVALVVDQLYFQHEAVVHHQLSSHTICDSLGQ